MKEHIHKYYRTVLGARKIIKDENGTRKIIPAEGKEIFRCGIPGCTTYRPRSLVLGLKSLCWVCGEELILSTENTKLKKPTHKFCRKRKELVYSAENNN